jgi:hypothetical protein
VRVHPVANSTCMLFLEAFRAPEIKIKITVEFPVFVYQYSEKTKEKHLFIHINLKQ